MLKLLLAAGSALLGVVYTPTISHLPKESPLAAYSDEWNQPVYQQCNTAADAAYMSNDEKEVIWILNMARKNPALFASTVIKKYPDNSSEKNLRNVKEYKSLLTMMSRMSPLDILQPGSSNYFSAQCHAVSAGKKGYVGHQRQSKECKEKKHYSGECCQYGYSNPLSIVMDLLIDQGVASLGHRYICLDKDYKTIGVSIQPHKQYGTNTVLDFY